MKVLLDTSIWIDYLRGIDPAVVDRVDGYLDRESVLMCGPVIAQLLAGTPPEDREEVWLALGHLPWADLNREAWRRVGELAHDLRQTGTSVPLTDLAIAVAAVIAEAELWSRDADFERIGTALPTLTLHAPG